MGGSIIYSYYNIKKEGLSPSFLKSTTHSGMSIYVGLVVLFTTSPGFVSSGAGVGERVFSEGGVDVNCTVSISISVSTAKFKTITIHI